MNEQIEKRLLRAPVIPLLQCDDPDVALRITQALLKGGLTVVEVVLRTKRALKETKFLKP